MSTTQPAWNASYLKSLISPTVASGHDPISHLPRTAKLTHSSPPRKPIGPFESQSLSFPYHGKPSTYSIPGEKVLASHHFRPLPRFIYYLASCHFLPSWLGLNFFPQTKSSSFSSTSVTFTGHESHSAQRFTTSSKESAHDTAGLGSGLGLAPLSRYMLLSEGQQLSMLFRSIK